MSAEALIAIGVALVAVGLLFALHRWPHSGARPALWIGLSACAVVLGALGLGAWARRARRLALEAELSALRSEALERLASTHEHVRVAREHHTRAEALEADLAKIDGRPARPLEDVARETDARLDEREPRE